MSHVVIQGAGIAGCALAFQLARDGHEVTVIERASAPRSGGQAVDVRGAALKVVEQMGLADDIRRGGPNCTACRSTTRAGGRSKPRQSGTRRRPGLQRGHRTVQGRPRQNPYRGDGEPCRVLLRRPDRVAARARRRHRGSSCQRRATDGRPGRRRGRAALGRSSPSVPAGRCPCPPAWHLRRHLHRSEPYCLAGLADRVPCAGSCRHYRSYP